MWLKKLFVQFCFKKTNPKPHSCGVLFCLEKEKPGRFTNETVNHIWVHSELLWYEVEHSLEKLLREIILNFWMKKILQGEPLSVYGEKGKFTECVETAAIAGSSRTRKGWN